MGDSWDDAADGWDDDEAVRAYARAAFDSLETVLADRGATLDGRRVLDFGCGTGLLTERLAESASAIDAVDSSSAMLAVLDGKVADRRWRHVSTSRDIPGEADSHDLIVCSSVCGFLDDYPGTVRRLARLLRPGGIFVQWDWERDNDADGHGLTRSEIAGALTAAGFTDVEVDTAFEVSIGDALMRPLRGVGQIAPVAAGADGGPSPSGSVT